jgi:hypothetical protein
MQAEQGILKHLAKQKRLFAGDEADFPRPTVPRVCLLVVVVEFELTSTAVWQLVTLRPGIEGGFDDASVRDATKQLLSQLETEVRRLRDSDAQFVRTTIAAMKTLANHVVEGKARADRTGVFSAPARREQSLSSGSRVRSRVHHWSVSRCWTCGRGQRLYVQTSTRCSRHSCRRTPPRSCASVIQTSAVWGLCRT